MKLWNGRKPIVLGVLAFAGQTGLMIFIAIRPMIWQRLAGHQKINVFIKYAYIQNLNHFVTFELGL